MIEATSHGDKEMSSLVFLLMLQGVQHKIEWGASSIILSFFNKWFFLSALSL